MQVVRGVKGADLLGRTSHFEAEKDDHLARSIKPTRRRLRIVAWLVVLLGLCSFALVDGAPTLDRPPRPSARDVNTAREGWRQLKDAQLANRPIRIRLDSSMLKTLSSFAGDVSGIPRVKAGLSGGRLFAGASISLPAGMWLNVSATATGTHDGFPDFRPTIGKVTFPDFVGRWSAVFGRWVLILNGASVPPLDSLARHISINQNAIFVVLALPQKSGLIDSLISATTPELNNQAVSEVYCKLAAEQREKPVGSLSALVRRAFGKSSGRDLPEDNRAVFVALAFVVVGEKAHTLAPEAAKLTTTCLPFAQRISLQTREDLAKHWTLSAALTSVFGSQTSSSLGEWKELSDSLPMGSGFSFVDLAADRSGTRFALQGSDLKSATALAKRLRHASENDLLPPTLLAGRERLPEANFTDQYGGLQDARYTEAIRLIDSAFAH